jgi:MFS family permease
VTATPPTFPAPPAGYRWFVLLACSIAMFGNYYAFDALYAVTDALQKELGFDGKAIGLLDNAYNIAALLTLLAGGVMIDRLGTARSVLIFASIGALGTLCIATLPALLPSAPLVGMATGRFLLGIGAELFIVASTTVVGRWFKAKEVSFALAIQLLIARFGSMVADRSQSLFPDLFGSWQKPLLLAAAFGGGWFLFAALYSWLESRAGKRYGVAQTTTTDKLVFADLVRFPKAYWYVVGLCVAFYATVFPFRSFANLYLVEAHGITPERAGELKSWMPIFSMIGMPLFGLLVDKVGQRARLLLVGSVVFMPPFLLMAYTQLPLELSMAMLGIAFALVPAVLWPAVTYLVSEARLGSAYALMTFCQQAGWMAISFGVGAAKDAAEASAKNPAGWLPMNWILASLSTAGVVCALLLWRSGHGPKGHGLDQVKPRGLGATEAN